MSGNGELRGLDRRLDGALASYAATEAELESRRRQPPAPGDLLVLPQASTDIDLEWLLVEGDGARFLAIPADTRPLLGSADVGVPEDAPAGPLSLRPRFALWLDTDRLDPQWTSGRLESPYVMRARDKHQALLAGNIDARPRDEEVDASPEYQDWCRQLATARNALKEVAAGERPPAPSVPPPRSARLLELAAAIFLVASLALLALHLRQTRQLEEVVAESQRRELDARRRIDELQRRLLEPRVNLPFAWFAAGSDPRRGDALPLTLEVPDDAEAFLLVLPVSDPRPYDKYRLEILRRGQGQEVLWSSDELRRTGAVEILVVLPRTLLAGGEYRLDLSGLADGEAHLSNRYHLRLAVSDR